MISSCYNAKYNIKHELIYHYAVVNDLAPNVVMGLIEKESNFDSKARGLAGEIGLMQIMPKWHLKRCELSDKDELYGIHENLSCGCSLLSSEYKKDFSIVNALARYNAGVRGHLLSVGKNYAMDVLERSKKYL